MRISKESFVALSVGNTTHVDWVSNNTYIYAMCITEFRSAKDKKSGNV